MGRHADGRRRLAAGGDAAVVAAGVASVGRGWLGPRVPVFGTGFPGQEPVQFGACQGFPAVAAARVQVCGQVGQHVQPGHAGGGGDGPERGGQPGGVLVPRAAGVLPGDDGAADRPLGRVVILMPISA